MLEKANVTSDFLDAVSMAHKTDHIIQICEWLQTFVKKYEKIT